MTLQFLFDTRAQRYRYTTGAGKGQFLSKKAMLALTKEHLFNLEDDVITLANLLRLEKISVRSWEEQTAIAIKKAHTQQFLLGLGGVHNLTPQDKQILNQRLKRQMVFFRKFGDDLRAGKLSEKQFEHRINMYLDATKGSFDKGKTHSHIHAGFTWERRIRTKNESCIECITYSQWGWQPIGTLPEPTEECSCLTNCGCFKIYSDSQTKPETDTSLLTSAYGWL